MNPKRPKAPRWRLALLVVCLLALLALAAQAQPKPVFTAANWTEMVGFKPDTSKAPVNVGQTIQEGAYHGMDAYVPPGLKLLVDKYKLKMKVKAYEAIHPSVGYIEATNKYYGQPELIDIGKDVRKRGIKNYTGGLPFPKPKDGLQVAWNYTYAYFGDDGDNYYGVYWISANSGVEHFEHWRWAYIIRAMYRADLDPRPHIPMFEKKNLQYTSITYALSPADKRGFGALYSRSVDPLDQQGHIYVPQMRRILRNTFGTRGDTWNATDLLYEDVRGYMGYPEWMNWKLLRQDTILLPMHAGIELGEDKVDKTFDMKNYPYWNPKMNWEPRAVYVVECTPKLPDYPYSKQIMYFDAETFYLPYKEAYDKKGDLWKVLITAFNKSPDMDKLPSGIGTNLVVDVQAEHATAFPWFSATANTNLDPSLFTEAALRKRGR